MINLQQRFLTHLQWAHDHGVLEEISAFLDTPGPDDWHVNEQDY